MGAIMQLLESVSGTSGCHVSAGQCWWVLLMSDAMRDFSVQGRAVRV